jgi:hypothetical protein
MSIPSFLVNEEVFQAYLEEGGDKQNLGGIWAAVFSGRSGGTRMVAMIQSGRLTFLCAGIEIEKK